jgi:hypothetical protein
MLVRTDLMTCIIESESNQIKKIETKFINIDS